MRLGKIFKSKWAATLLVGWLLVLTACDNNPVFSPTPAFLPTITPSLAPTAQPTLITTTPTKVAALPMLTPTATSAATATPVLAPTAAPTPKPFVMSNGVMLEPPTIPFSSVAIPPALDKMDLSDFGNALNPESKVDLTLVKAMQPPVYNIALKVLPDAKTPAAAGHEQIFYTNNTGEALPNLVLWLYANAPITDTLNPPVAVSNVKVDGQYAQTELENNAATLDIKFDATQPLQPGVTIAVELDFKLAVPTDLESGYFRYDAANNIFALLYWYPQVAVFDRKLTDGWDTHPYNPIGDITNSNVALFKVWLTAPSDEVLAVNAQKTDSYLNSDGTRTTLFVSGPIRDFVGSLSPNYQTVSQQVSSTLVTSYFLARDKVFGSKALGYAANAFQTYRDAFGRYPYAQFNVVEAPLVPWGGLEFPGEVYITTRYYEPSYLSSFEFAVIHETGHQWWYGMVGSDQIRAPWQDEALTQFCGVLYYERFRDAPTVQKIYNTYFKAAYLDLLNKNLDYVVARPVYAYDNISLYSIIAYNKAGLFYDAYRKQFGDAAFLRFTRYYLEHNRYKFVGPEALVDALKQGVNNDPDQTKQVLELYRHWILAAEGAQDKAKLQ